MRRKLLILSACLLALVGAAAAYAALFDHWPGSSKNATPADTSRRNAVAAMGRIEPRSGIINLGAGSPPDRLESLLVERGDLVKKGDVLGYLAGYAEQIAQRDLIKAQIDEARLRRDTELRLNQRCLRSFDSNIWSIKRTPRYRSRWRTPRLSARWLRFRSARSISSSRWRRRVPNG